MRDIDVTSGAAAKAVERIQRAAEKGFPALRHASEGAQFFLDHQRLTHLVLQGGGTLGIAHLGFVFGLECGAIRPLGLAGTSAGAIVALLMMAARGKEVDSPVAKRLVPILEAMPAAGFVDGPYLSRRLIAMALGDWKSQIHEAVIPLVSAWRKVLRDYGLNRGLLFEQWLAQILHREFDIRTVGDVRAMLQAVAEPARISSASSTGLLQINATAMPIGLKITFPKHVPLFDERYEQSSPALWARASMSVPLFFEPLELVLGRAAWSTFVDAELTQRYSSSFISQAKSLAHLQFIDGGLLSNFPIDAFSSIEGPPYPTIGVALVPSSIRTVEAPRGSLKALAQYAGGALNAMRHLRDREALERVRLDRSRRTEVAFVGTGDHHWLNFNLTSDAVEDLFLRGLLACADFLCRDNNP